MASIMLEETVEIAKAIYAKDKTMGKPFDYVINFDSSGYQGLLLLETSELETNIEKLQKIKPYILFGYRIASQIGKRLPLEYSNKI